ncbi:ap-3 complex subunit beta-1 [Moniliophthora roreri]|nr:ap-3 complex subunit beta-1 [Moniliophthora roreri]
MNSSMRRRKMSLAHLFFHTSTTQHPLRLLRHTSPLPEVVEHVGFCDIIVLPKRGEEISGIGMVQRHRTWVGG